MQRLFFILVFTFGLLFAGAFTVSAQTQLLQNKDTKDSATGMEKIVEEARQNGSTVIIVQPKANEPVPVSDTMAQSARRFLDLRLRLRNIFASASGLPANVAATFAIADRDLGYGWFTKAIGTALLGIFVGWLLTRPYLNFLKARYQNRRSIVSQTTADKAKFLLFRAFIALTITAIYGLAAATTAIVLDSGEAFSRRLIFDVVGAYLIYRILRYVVGWNLLADDSPNNRLLNLTDQQAKRLYTLWWVASAVTIALAVIIRFIIAVGFNAPQSGYDGNGALPMANAQLLLIVLALFVVLIIIGLMVANRKMGRLVFQPRDPSGLSGRIKTGLANILPVLIPIYAAAAFFMFTYRVAMLIPAASSVIVAPFVVLYVSLIVIGIAFIAIQLFYERRLRVFEERVAAERNARRQAQREMQAVRDAAARDGDDDEDDQSAQNEVIEANLLADEQIFAFQPRFREFFENAAIAIVVMLALGRLLNVWGFPISAEGNFWSIAYDLLLISIFLILAYNAVRIFIDAKMEEEGGDTEVEMGGDGGGAGASRMATLLPIFRYVLLVFIFIVASMLILSRLGLDIGPIFASAGVLGIAIGFGAQKLIQDIISGAFFLLDDAFRKGEYVEIEGIKGTVEKISIRSFQLRHHLGALHTLPFGEIRKLTNYSRDWVLMKLPLRVTYDTDVEKVRKLVKKLGQELLQDPQVGHTFMQPLKSQGVYKMEDSAMIIRVKFMTKPGEQFVTRKVVYERIQDLFAREDIHFAHKEVTVRLADGVRSEDLSEADKQAVSAAARSVIDAEEAEAAAASAGKAGDSGGR